MAAQYIDRTNPKPRATTRLEFLRRTIRWRDYLVYFVLLGLIVLFAATAGTKFLSVRNLAMILQQAPTLIILAIGLTFVITMGSIDLSTGSMLGLVTLVTALSIERLGSVGIVAGITAGMASGLLNGVLYTYLRVPSFVVTLGTMVILRAVVIILSGGFAVYLPGELGSSNSWMRWLGSYPGIDVVLVGVIGVAALIYHKTVFGNDLRAIGGNERVAALLGVPVARYKVYALTLMGALAGVAGVLNLMRMGAATPVSGSGLELDVVSAVVLGGTPLTGGRGSIGNTVVGALILTVLANGLTILGVSPEMNDMVRGSLLLAAVALALERRKIGIIK